MASDIRFMYFSRRKKYEILRVAMTREIYGLEEECAVGKKKSIVKVLLGTTSMYSPCSYLWITEGKNCSHVKRDRM
jgi:hypothetical protein